MKAKIKKPVFTFTPAMLDITAKFNYIDVAVRELCVQLSAQTGLSVEQVISAVYVSASACDTEVTYCNNTSKDFYDRFDALKKALLNDIKEYKENFENEYC